MADILLMTMVVLLGLILLSLWIVLYQLVKQQGRMLLRLDAMEGRFAHGARGTVTTGLTVDGVQARPRGLPLGTPLPPFTYLILRGKWWP